MACFPERFETPVIVRQWRDKPSKEHNGHNPPCKLCSACQQNIGHIHGNFHGDHGDKGHADCRAKGIAQHHLPGQDKCFQCHRGGKTIDDRQRHDCQCRPGDSGKLKKCDRAEITDRASEQAPGCVDACRAPCVLASPVNRSCVLALSGFGFLSRVVIFCHLRILSHLGVLILHSSESIRGTSAHGSRYGQGQVVDNRVKPDMGDQLMGHELANPRRRTGWGRAGPNLIGNLPDKKRKRLLPREGSSGRSLMMRSKRKGGGREEAF